MASKPHADFDRMLNNILFGPYRKSPAPVRVVVKQAPPEAIDELLDTELARREEEDFTSWCTRVLEKIEQRMIQRKEAGV